MGLLENEFLKYLSKFDEYSYDVELDKVMYRIGNGKPRFKVKFNRLPDIEELLKSTTVAFGEAYMEGDLEIEGDLYKVLRIFLKQADRFSMAKKELKKMRNRSDTKKSIRKKIKPQYELGIHFYELMLDDTMCYSTAYFKDEKEGLFEAQHNNMNHIFDKLGIKEGMTVCDISYSWGSLLIEAAKKYNVSGIIVTFGRTQEVEIKDKIKQEGLEGQIEVKNIDYRELPYLNYKFDRVISIDVLEYIGLDFYDNFFNTIKNIMKEDGLFLLQTLNTSKKDAAMPWVKKYIKSGADIPVIQNIINSSLLSGLKLIDVEDMRKNAARTFKCWSENFLDNEEEIEEMYDQKFIRAWKLYLNAYKAAYTIGMLDSHQILFSNGTNNNLNMIRGM